MKNVYDELQQRGFIEQVTDAEGLGNLLASPQAVYCGFDPTADSLHLGNLIPVNALAHLQRHGHRVIVLMGGATGMIGDPSYRSSERALLNEATLQANLEALWKQISHFIEFVVSEGRPPALVVNNFEWTDGVTIIEWLRDVGKHFTVNYMVAKESVRSRFEDREQGISFTEFSYMLLQANDFQHLYEEYGCRVQVGGSDQWGNITAGIDFIRRKGGEQTYGMTFPLLTTASGQKFGKSEAGAVWLDERKTGVWDFYQYLVRSDDRDVIRFLRLFTFLPLDEIESLGAELKRDPGARVAQKRLAYEVTATVHGREQADRMQRGAEALYAGRLEELDAGLIAQVFAEGPAVDLARARLEKGVPIVDLAVETGLVKSKGEARRMLKQGALYVNDRRVDDERVVGVGDMLPSETVILRKGKKDYLVIRVDVAQ